MTIELPIRFIKSVLTPDQAKSERWIREFRYHADDDDEIKINAESLSNTQLDALAKVLAANPGFKGVANKVTAYKNVRNDDKHEKPIKRLNLLETALIACIRKLPNKWLYMTGDDGKLCPYYVDRIEYAPANQRRGIEAGTLISFYYVVRDKRQHKSITWRQSDLKNGMTVIQLLSDESYLPETEELNVAYAQEMERYAAINHNTGFQYLANGMALNISGWDYRQQPMVRDGEPSKVVMDDDDPEGASSSSDGETRSASGAFWGRLQNVETDKDEDGDDDETSVTLPVHPYVKIFDLKTHQFMMIHATNLVEYAYDKSLIDKLVLPQNQKDLVTILIASSTVVLEDIVKGKTGGVIVIATGPPGTGKTLTAEVCAEAVERPLYCVQCAQLGTDAEDLEQKLQAVLNRASRWKAILLIDEADVYVHERGTDIEQNAIVGVWLRLMEYYRGIMFMTSNRDVIIDDAILSRATAWIRYAIPDAEKLARIWQVLSAQYGVKAIDTGYLAKRYLGISGRSVKNLLKLSKLLSASKGPVTTEMIDYCSQFLDIEPATKSDPESSDPYRRVFNISGPFPE